MRPELIPARRRGAIFFGLLAGMLLAAGGQAGAALDEGTAASGIREALSTGASRAVEALGRVDGYLGNVEVRIPVPDQLELLEKTLKTLGRDDLVDEFLTSMNRAAEAAAPLARQVFLDAIRDMTIQDALTIVRGEGHEATDYLAASSRPELQGLFQPLVRQQLDEVGATRSFNGLMEETARVPFMRRPAFDLGEYVTGKALDGLFLMLAREEEKIRKDPVARTTDLLKRVFGGEEESGARKRGWLRRLFGRE